MMQLRAGVALTVLTGLDYLRECGVGIRDIEMQRDRRAAERER